MTNNDDMFKDAGKPVSLDRLYEATAKYQEAIDNAKQLTDTQRDLDKHTQYPKPTGIATSQAELKAWEEMTAKPPRIDPTSLEIKHTEQLVDASATVHDIRNVAIERANDLLDRIDLAVKIAVLETELEKLRKDYTRLQRSNNGMEAELTTVREKLTTARRREAQAIAIIANAEDYIAKNTKLDRVKLLAILMKEIE